VGHTKLIDVTRKDCFPQPRIDDTLDTLAGVLKNGYWRVALHAEKNTNKDGIGGVLPKYRTDRSE
jgi:hypothetical protein